MNARALVASRDVRQSMRALETEDLEDFHATARMLVPLPIVECRVGAVGTSKDW